MGSLVARLHPTGWTDELFSATVRLAVIALIALVAAWAVGPLLARWMGRAAAVPGTRPPRVLGGLRASVILYGLYEGVSMLPGLPTATAALSGLLFVLLVLVATRTLIVGLAGGLGNYVARRGLGPERERAQREYLPLANALVTIALGLSAITLIAHHFGHDVSSLVAALGVGSLAIGLAAQQTLGNMIAGFLLLVDRPFGPGDQIRLQSGEAGTIDQIGIRSTRLRLGDGNLLVVPNAEVANTRVVNLSRAGAMAHGEVRCRVTWAMAPAAERALLGAARAQAEIAAEPAAIVRIAAIEPDAVELALQFEVPAALRVAVEGRVRAALLGELSAKRAVAPA